MSDKEFEDSTGGRRKIKLSPKAFKKACEYQFTKLEVCGWFDVSESTIDRRCIEWFGECFEDVFKKLSAGGKASLRRKQFQVAMTGNVPMLIWLGKQMLGQKEIVAPAVHEFDIPVPTYKLKSVTA